MIKVMKVPTGVTEQEEPRDQEQAGQITTLAPASTSVLGRVDNSDQ